MTAALGFGGCGDDETTSTVPETTEAPASTSTSSSTATSTSTSSSTSTAPTTSTTSTASTTTEDSGGVSPGGYDPNQPDSETNDKPPKPGSPEESFEQACEENPESCG